MEVEAPPHDRRVFCTMGHGCDDVPDQIQFAPPVNLPEFRIPKGCIFVTIEVCGIYSTDIQLQKIFQAFQDPIWKEALKYPDNNKIWKILHEYLQINSDDNDVLRVRTEGDIFTNPHISLFDASLDGEDSEFSQSGIYELGHMPQRNGRMLQWVRTPMNQDELEMYKDKREIKPTEVSHDRLAQIYNGSIFPTVNQVIEGVSTEYRYIDLMTGNPGPGVYYHFSCRSPCDLANYDPKFNYNDAISAARLSAPDGTSNQTRELEKVSKYYSEHVRKHPVMQRMRQRSVNQVMHHMRNGQKGRNEKNIVQTRVSEIDSYTIYNWKIYINNQDLRRDWIARIFVELCTIVPIHGHSLIRWEGDIPKKCYVCGEEELYTTYHCARDDYHECEDCYTYRRQISERKQRPAWYQRLYNMAPWRGSGYKTRKMHRKKINRQTRKRFTRKRFTHKRSTRKISYDKYKINN
jgi:hypothetical protein